MHIILSLSLHFYLLLNICNVSISQNVIDEAVDKWKSDYVHA